MKHLFFTCITIGLLTSLSACKKDDNGVTGGSHLSSNTILINGVSYKIKEITRSKQGLSYDLNGYLDSLHANRLTLGVNYAYPSVSRYYPVYTDATSADFLSIDMVLNTQSYGSLNLKPVKAFIGVADNKLTIDIPQLWLNNTASADDSILFSALISEK